MRFSIVVALVVGLVPIASADVILTSFGKVKITPVYHGSVMLEVGGKVWHVDPWSRGDYSTLPRADVILITDVHGDHMDPKAIEAIRKPSTIVIAPAAVARTVTEAKIISNGEDVIVSGVRIEAVPMYNLKRGPAIGKLYHDKGRGNGYVLNVGDKRIYFSGDTEVQPEMKALKDIDVAFITMNLPYTMSPNEAAEGVKHFRPKVVYPYHYRGADLKVFVDALEGEKEIEVRLREWY